MKVQWLKHGKWSPLLQGLHYYTIGSFVLLIATGMALYYPAVHTVLIPYLPLIYKVHILLGLVFGVTLLTPLLRLLPKGKTIWRLDWLIPLVFGGAIVATGLLLWGVTVFPTVWRAPAFAWHGYFTSVLGAWVLIHAFYKVLGLRPRPNGWAGRIDPERRQFIRWLGVGVLGGALWTVLDPAAALRSLLSLGGGVSTAGGGTGSNGFAEYYTVINGFPSTTLDKYRLTVNGQVAKPQTLTWTELQSLPPLSEQENFHCVTGWSVAGVHWEGVHISQLASLVEPESDVQYVHFYSFDGVYTESLRLAEALDPTVLLAYKLNGQPLRKEAGFPVRLVVPKMYGYKSIKWVSRVEFSTHPLTGYWEARGYPSEAFL
ncbi:molybdopterin-dependent oxidoreductase [Alicyclobacillus tolerans]|uniref:molybdopterin-dependent oxidoreductase n=1 Tax=Alicyclobacillus tolerans TaxID=90970 RepID=UPI001F186336|nr:molybdopterin-dependent oxidoreductase [Alicyclobacillus tolerans]MCF8568444.1 molybdopterin-dependent oxidoreductase [Alicyclobacillus tolerans]